MTLRNNGALDPDQWRPNYANLKHGVGLSIAEEGDLVGWRYGAWRVIEVRFREDHDLSDDDRATLNRIVNGRREEYRAKAWMDHRPRVVVIRHESGPLILKAGEKVSRLHDGGKTLHFDTGPQSNAAWAVLDEPHQVCSCHGHIWPCREVDRNAVAEHEADKVSQLMATTDPGTCAHCLEVITTRQRSVTFPEESRFVPGAPGPTFHAGRADCWAAAEDYERNGRLKDDPGTPRLASCPGIRFVHEKRDMPAAQRIECTAGPMCTGLHGPSGYRAEVPCWGQVDLDVDGAFARPGFDCGYQLPHRRCLGGGSLAAGSATPMAADVLWERSSRNKGRS